MTPKARPIFSEAALSRLDCDEPIAATDPVTGVDLSYRFEPGIGGTLRLTGGAIGERTLTLGCDEADLELVARLLLDGLKVRRDACLPPVVRP